MPLMSEEAEVLVSNNLATYVPTTTTQLNLNAKQVEIFTNLWSMNFFLTSAKKFGADYLVYKKDPSTNHSDHIVHCYDSVTVSIPVSTLIAKVRLANTVKKTAVLAFHDSTNIQFVSLKWLPFN